MLEELLIGLQNGIVKFEYDKKEGESRVAFGTLNKDLIPNYIKLEDVTELVETVTNLANNMQKVLDNPAMLQDREPLLNSIDWVSDAAKPFLPKEKKVTEKKETPYISYYDFGAKGWRMFHKENIVSIY